MDDQNRQLARYLEDTLAIAIAPQQWPGRKRLPPLLQDLYRFAEISLFGTTCLLMIDAENGERSPATVRKHMELLRDKYDGFAIYVCEQVTAYNRKRLIEQKVPFIVPGNQMYLPILGIDLREHFKRTRTEQPKVGPATQALILHTLLRDAPGPWTPAELAEELGYSAMTMTRVFDELEAIRFGEISMRGRERRLQLREIRKELWTQVEPLLRSPVTKRVFIRRIPLGANALLTGLAALARRSMLALPPHAQHALGREDWKMVRAQHNVVEVPESDPDVQEIEVWSYRPALLARGPEVDPLSLYLTLRGNRDERVEAALEELLKAVKW